MSGGRVRRPATGDAATRTSVAPMRAALEKGMCRAALDGRIQTGLNQRLPVATDKRTLPMPVEGALNASRPQWARYP